MHNINFPSGGTSFGLEITNYLHIPQPFHFLPSRCEKMAPTFQVDQFTPKMKGLVKSNLIKMGALTNAF
jgi:hypothetical protein